MIHEINGLEVPIFDLDGDSRKVARGLNEIGKAYGKRSVTYKKAAAVISLSRRYLEAINEKVQQIASGSSNVYRGGRADRKRIIEASIRVNSRNAIASLTQVQNRYQEEMTRHCKPQPLISDEAILILDDLIEAGVLRTGKKYSGADASDLAVSLFKTPAPLVERLGYSHEDPNLMKKASPRGAEAIDQAARILKVVDLCRLRFAAISAWNYKDAKAQAKKESKQPRSTKQRSRQQATA